MRDFKAELDRHLARDVEKVSGWEATAFDELLETPNQPLVLCGAGGLGRKTLQGLKQHGVMPVAFADNNPTLAGRNIDGVPVFAATEAAQKFRRDAAFVVTVWGAHSGDRLADRKRQWQSANCKTVTSFMPLFWKHSETFLPHYSCDLPHKVFKERERIADLLSLWSDDTSKAEFIAQLRWRSELDFEGLPEPVSGRPYFSEDLFALIPNEKFVDCGAYDGDTLTDFLHLSRGRFEKFWAIEPDPRNFEKLRQIVDELPVQQSSRIELICVAASDRSQRLRFAAESSASSAASAQGNIEVEARRLDEIIVGDSPSFIKMDIEGAELDALNGATTLIARSRPVFAVCIYHLQEHLWTIPQWLREHLVDYDFYLRPHDREGWDLVCYAVPYERSLKRIRHD